MKKLLLACIASMALSFAYAQNMILSDPISGRTFNSDQYAEIKGTPFLNEKWMTASVVTPKGIYKSLEVKLDLYDNQVLFSKDDNSYELQDEVLLLTLMKKPSDSSSYQYFKKGFTASSLRKEQFVQVLAEGKTGFYRSDIKLMSEMSEVNKGMVKSFSTVTRYFVGNDNLQIIKLAKADVLGAVGDQAAKVEAYAKENNLSFKKEADVVQMIRYYNTL